MAFRNFLKKYKWIQHPAAGKTVACFGVLIFGMAGMVVLGSLKEAPAGVDWSEPKLKVQTMVAEPKDYPVFITGYGEAKPVEIVPVAPEVSGTVVAVHPELKAGGLVRKGEVLFRIDDAELRLTVESGMRRLAILERKREIAEQELERARLMLERERIGTRSGVEKAEKGYLSVSETENEVRKLIRTAELNLARCVVRARFDGRIRDAAVENGQFLVAGKRVLTIVNDALLEILVPIKSEDARNWLSFKENKGEGLWFSGIEQVRCDVRWTEAGAESGNGTWSGVLDRVVQFNRMTRTLTLAVRLYRKGNMTAGGLPIVDGMFCHVIIPGRPMKQVTRLPSWLVSFDNTVFRAVENRLVTTPVTVLRNDGGYVYIADGLSSGDIIITSRLTTALENTLLEQVGAPKTEAVLK